MERFVWLLGSRAIIQHGRRNFIAGLAIGLGLMAVLTLIGYSNRINNYLTVSSMYLQQPGHVAIMKKNGIRKRFSDPRNFSLEARETTAIYRSLAKDPNYDFASTYLFGAGLIGNGCQSFPFKATAYDFAIDRRIKTHPELLTHMPNYRPFLKSVNLPDPAGNSPVGISVGLAKKLRKTFEPILGQDEKLFDTEDCLKPEQMNKLSADSSVQLVVEDFGGHLNANDASLVNLFTTGVSFTDNSALTIGLGQLQELLRTDKSTYIAVFLKDRDSASQFASDIMRTMARQDIAISAYAWDDKIWNFNFFASRNILVVANTFAGVVIFIVVILSIVNTLNIGLVEARRETGTLRALGYTPGQIANIFAIEALLVACMALALGAIASRLTFQAVAALAIPFQIPGASQPTTFLIVPPAWAYPAAAAGLLCLVVFTNYVIARRYASQDPLVLLDRGN